MSVRIFGCGNRWRRRAAVPPPCPPSLAHSALPSPRRIRYHRSETDQFFRASRSGRTLGQKNQEGAEGSGSEEEANPRACHRGPEPGPYPTVRRQFRLYLRSGEQRLWLRRFGEHVRRELFAQPYFKAQGAPKPKVNAKTVRNKVPKVNKVRTAFFRHARRLKSDALKVMLGAKPYG